jgi:4-methoxybenzoate monooxygenase (O-demethylating)
MGALGEAAVLTANKGIAQCLGQIMAWLEGQLVFLALLPRIRSIRLAGPPVRQLNNTLHSLASLPVEVEAA